MARKIKMTREEQAHADAKRQSQIEGDIRFVVYVPDDGPAVYNRAQMKMYGALVFVEGAYLFGDCVSTMNLAVAQGVAA